MAQQKIGVILIHSHQMAVKQKDFNFLIFWGGLSICEFLFVCYIPVFLSVKLHIVQNHYVLAQQFSTGVLQEILKYVIPDYLIRGTDFFSLRWSNTKMTANQYNNSHLVWMDQNYTYFLLCHRILVINLCVPWNDKGCKSLVWPTKIAENVFQFLPAYPYDFKKSQIIGNRNKSLKILF